ncbi:AIPR protein [Paenibacillus larvae subsp. pulvifaciens]|uniref:AIPR protein n=1 Tax=Paenibacillus larvae subsp. pulvifaciens TaxID=1477 RepID=A0A1V0UP65_9BACL|nr:AIPR family protein [Paenibacillus larvae]ARF66917.1 AIPR protein [Paenibacillus larvae subsp. pulvifaciens]
MLESRQRSEFLKEFLEEIEEKAAKTGVYLVPFLEKMLLFMERDVEPDILIPPYIDTQKKIAVNAYSFDESQRVLDIYIANYNFDQNEHVLLSISMTMLIDLANQAKRFITNAKTLAQTIDHSLQARELAVLISENINVIDEVNIFVLTNMFYNANKPIELSIPGIETVNVQVWDIDRILQMILAEQGIQTIHIDFGHDLGQTFEMMYVPNNRHEGVKNYFSCYVGFVPAELLAKAYDQWGSKLVERNVRSFLQARGGTNKGILKTLKDPNERRMFVSYNNGISSVARSGDIEKINENINLYRIKGLTGWQIVNGGQTTASIHQAYKSDIDLTDVYIQAKLTILHIEADQGKDHQLLEDEMVTSISKYANTQNKINNSDLLANSRFMSDLEKFSRDSWIPTNDGRRAESKWYFERARGQYAVDLNRRKRGKEQNEFKKQYPREKVITKVDLAKHFMSYEGFPHISSKGGEEAFKRFMEQNKQYWKYDKDDNDEIIPLSEVTLEVFQKLIARTIINFHVTNIVESMRLQGYRANVIYYTVAMLHHIYGHKIELIDVWHRQTLSDKWDEVIQIIADRALFFLRNSAGNRNVTQWAKQEACWIQFKDEYTKQLSNIV